MRHSIPYYYSTVALLAARGYAVRCSVSPFAFTRADTARHGFYKTRRNRLLGVPNKPFTDFSDTELKIRLIQTEKEFESIIINAMVKEGWGPGLQDAECFMACDPTAGFVGELNGKPVCCMTMAKYGDSYAFAGSYIVNKEFRGNGHGKKIYDAAMASAKHFPSIGTIAGLNMEEINKSNGFRSLFYGAFFVFNIPTTIACFSETSITSPSVKIKRIEEVNKQALFMYDTTVFGFERHAFLSKWLRMTGSHVPVAIDSEGSIVGYTVARPTFIKGSYKIGPLFADSEAVAEMLLKAVFEELLPQEKPAPVVCIDAPTEKATKLCERLQGKRSLELVYMVMNDLPDACFDKWFGYTTVQFG